MGKKQANKKGGDNAQLIKKGGDNTQPKSMGPQNGGQKPSSDPAPTRRTKESNSSLWCMIFLITVGCGCAFSFFMYEMDLTKTALVKEIEQLSKELETVASLRSDIKANKASLNGLSKVQDSFEAMKDQMKQSEQSTRSFNVEIPKLSSRVKQSEETLKNQLTHMEKSIQQLEARNSERISLLEQFNAKEIERLTKLTVETKQLAEGLRANHADLQQNMKTEISDSLRKVVQDVAQLQASVEYFNTKETSLQEEISKMKLKSVTDVDLNEVKEQVLQLTDKATKTGNAYASVQGAIDDASQRFESQISVLTAHVKSGKDELSMMREEVNGLRQLSDEIKKMAEPQAQEAAKPKEKKP
uniref:uncharacterized protein LOC108949438 isoform X2 n=1 Tax=Ciona intestinalis TaxID=7719 RepID=UPI00089DBE0E|nr:uncharacterized protein LOC108949438 isoform X2 [Ciona intestinalis]|eukprot:XP_018667081.1 uncharacterized protein LOC108949438 isoform X2 [Ciona intestinalis]